MIDETGKFKDLAQGILALQGDALFFEDWGKEDSSVIDTEKWAIVCSGTGLASRSEATTYVYANLTGATNSDTSRIRTNRRWRFGPDSWNTNSLVRKLVIEWEVQMATVASLDNTVCFMGFGNTSTATRAVDNIAGFILTADALNAITDDGGAETVSALGAPVLTNWHKLRMEVYPSYRTGAWSGQVDFYVDEVLQATHTTAAAENLPDQMMYLHFYAAQEAAANGGIVRIGPVKVYYTQVPAPLADPSADVRAYLAALASRGMVCIQGTCDSEMAASTTAIISDDLAGYGNDYFNNHFYIWVIKNANSIGAAPDDEYSLITDYVSASGNFTVSGFSANVEANDVFLIIPSSVMSALDLIKGIYDTVNADLVTSETGATLTATGAEQDLYVNAIPSGAYKPLVLKVDMTNMAAGDTTTIRVYERLSAMGAMSKIDEKAFIGVQDPIQKSITLNAIRHGIRTTLEQSAGVNRAYTWEVVVEQ